MQRLAIILVSFITTAILSVSSAEATITYQIHNHPDGNQIGDDVDADGYVLRLDINGEVNTFNANHSELFFSYEPGGTTATIHGSVSHNESGEENIFEPGDDVWDIELRLDMASTFDDVLLTDGGTPWYGANDPHQTFDDMIAALLANGDDPDNDPGDESSTDFSEDVARIYFEMSGFSLDPQEMNPDYDGPRDWDEYPNPPDRKPFFLQYRWRLTDSEFSGEEFDMLGAAGWLEPHDPALINQNDERRCCQDFLFVIGERQFVPEPATGTLLMLAAAATLGVSRWRKRRSQRSAE